MAVALLSEKSLLNQMEEVMPAVHCLPSGLFTALFSLLFFFFFLAQQVKKSDRMRSGVPGADLCGGGVVSPARAEPAPACPVAFHLSPPCSEQWEAPASEGKEAETALPGWCPSLPHHVALSALQRSSHTFHYDFTALAPNWVKITSEVSAEVWRKWGHTYYCCCGGAFFFIGGRAVKTNEPLFLSLFLAIFMDFLMPFA